MLCKKQKEVQMVIQNEDSGEDIEGINNLFEVNQISVFSQLKWIMRCKRGMKN